MKKTIILFISALIAASCVNTQQRLKERAAELCRYIPDHELTLSAKEYMTDDFYSILDTMFNHLPEYEAMDHEWLYYFVTGNGGTIADYEVQSVTLTDDSHAVANILVRQVWEDGSFDEQTDTEEHRLYMEKVDGQWLMSDFDEHKQDCIRHIAISRQEQSVRDAISQYLVSEIGPQYLHGDMCVPSMLIVAAEDYPQGGDSAQIWCDCWVFWYNAIGDTLKTVSGGNHSGRITICQRDNRFVVTTFEQTTDGAGNDASAREIFGAHYDIYSGVHANHEVQEAVRKEQLKAYIDKNNLIFRYYQDFGWPAQEL